MVKMFVPVQVWIKNNSIFAKIWCMGFLSGFGHARGGKSKEWVKSVRMRSKGNLRTKGYVTAGKRGIAIYNCAKQKIEEIQDEKQFTFDKILQDAEKKYKSKEFKYEKSWKKMLPYDLRQMLNDEINEWDHRSEFGPSYEYDELLDIINCSCMLAARLRRRKNEK